MKVSALLTPVLLLAGQALAKNEPWINCKKGSRHCQWDNIGRKDPNSRNPTLADLIEASEWQINDTKVYDNEHYAVCVSSSKFDNWGVCAYPVQTENGINGSYVKQLLHKLQAHGCNRCGRVSTKPPMDLVYGRLEVNTADNIRWDKPVCRPKLVDMMVDWRQDKPFHDPPH